MTGSASPAIGLAGAVKIEVGLDGGGAIALEVTAT
jgi:hypothetical protein